MTKAAPPKAAEKKVEKTKQKEKKKDVKTIELVFDPEPAVMALNFGIAEFYLTDLLK